MWCVSKLNDSYIAKMEDILKLYERPYNATRAGCVFGREVNRIA